MMTTKEACPTRSPARHASSWRNGVETSFTYDGYRPYTHVRARNREGHHALSSFEVRIGDDADHHRRWLRFSARQSAGQQPAGHDARGARSSCQEGARGGSEAPRAGGQGSAVEAGRRKLRPTRARKPGRAASRLQPAAQRSRRRGSRRRCEVTRNNSREIPCTRLDSGEEAA
jgi:hypothetical protein